MQRSDIPLSPLPWDDIRLFLALIRARTVGDAARALGVDPSTVSRRLVALEEALSTTLFDRGRDGVRPTKAAEDLLPAAEMVEHGIAEFAHAADALEREISGLVRITCPRDVSEVVVIPVLRELFAQHPALRVTLDPGESILDLTRREADIALRIVRPERGDLIAKNVATVRWVAAASPALVNQLGMPRLWRDIPWITWGDGMAGVPAARWWRRHVHDAEPVLRSDGLTTQIAAAQAGIGVALMPAPSLEHYGLAPIRLGKKLRASARESTLR